jgi:hypothetical protein
LWDIIQIMTSEERAVILPIIYADCFDYCFDISELHQYTFNRNLSVSQVIKTVDILLSKNIVEMVGPRIVMFGRHNLATLTEKRKSLSLSKIKKAQALTYLFKFIPTIKLIGISGSVGSFNAEEDDDIDLFIVTSEHSLWATRAVFTSLLILVGAYRKGDKVKDKLCPNLWLSSNNLRLDRQNWFSATELCRLLVILDKDDTYLKLLNQNAWVTRYYPNRFSTDNIKISTQKKPLFWIEFNWLCSKINTLCFLVQYRWMKHKITKELISSDRAFFHPRNFESELLKKITPRLAIINGVQSVDTYWQL